MKSCSKLFIASFITLLLWSPNSFAAGLGIFIDASGGGSGEFEWESDFNSRNVDSKAAAFGFVLDTAPTNERVFNYRLNVGFARHEFDDIDKIKSKGIYAENIFGFALIKDETLRWWVGPLVRVGFYSGDTDTVQLGSGASMKTELDYAEFGVGAVTGLNVKVGNAILSPSIGVRFSGYGGEGEITTRDSFGTSSFKEDFEASATNIFANFALLF